VRRDPLAEVPKFAARSHHAKAYCATGA
jgi:hypothetical protein